MLKYLLLFLFLLYWINPYAQDYANFNSENGLPSNHIYDIQEDANGFIWIATNRGLVKYDGKKFKTFTIKDGLPNFPWLLELDYQDRLWYFSKSKYQGYIKNDSIYKFMHTSQEVLSPASGHYSTKNQFLFLTHKGILTLKDSLLVTEDLKRLNNTPKRDSTLLSSNLLKSNTPIFANTNTIQDKLLTLSKNKITIFDIDMQIVLEIKASFPRPKNTMFRTGLLYNQIGYIIYDQGIFFYDYIKNKYKFYNFKEHLETKSIVFGRAKGLKDEIQVSINGHLIIFDYNLEVTNTYSFPIEFTNDCSYRDSQGNIWFGGQEHGLYFLSSKQIQATYYFPNQRVHKINKINNHLYAGLPKNGIYLFDSTGFKLIHKFQETNFHVYKIKQSKYDKTEAIICNVYNLLKIKNSKIYVPKWEFKKYFHRPIQGLKDIIQFDEYEYLISSKQVFKSNTTTKQIIHVTNQVGLNHTEVLNHTLYLAGSPGLFELKDDSLIRPSINNLIEFPVSSLLATNDFLIVGTSGRGIYLYNEKEIIHLKKTDDLSVFKILKRDDLLWLATNNGVKVVELKNSDLENSKIVNSFYKSDGLLQNNTNDIYLEDNKLWIASDNGLAKINVDSKIYKQKPKSYFKERKDTLVFQGIERQQVSISLGNLDFSNQKHLTYYYRLLPNNYWIKTSTQILNFSNLSPRLHTLEVKAIDQHNNVSVIKKHIQIIPYWRETIYAKITGLILSIIGLFLFYKWIKKRITTQNEKKKNYKKRVISLELQALRSQMNPHFVHNSLNAILYFIQRNEVDLSEKYLTKFSKLIRRFFDYAQKQHITIAEDIDLLRNYLEIEQLRFEEKLTFEIIVDERLEIEDQIIPTMILQPIVENAVNHGIFHKESPGTVKIFFIYIDNFTYKVEIEDDGVGITKTKDIFKNSRKNYESRSSTVLQERLLLLKESSEWNIEYEMIDLANHSKNGTRVSILFKQN